MECKGARTSATLFSGLVLIETLWNVKKHTPHDCRHTFSVLIETLWNVKTICVHKTVWVDIVLIETLWNVKTIARSGIG